MTTFDLSIKFPLLINVSMKKYFTFLLCAIALKLSAQTTNISGIINQYAKVINVDKCLNQVTVDDITPFAVGDTVLIIQMAGSDIDNTNTSFYGNVNSYNNCGNYELAIINIIAANTITFKNVLNRRYNASGLVQLITVPIFNNTLINDTLKCRAWNGSTGGVTIVKALNKISIASAINLNGKGFRGADTLSDDCFNFGIGGCSDYRCNQFSLCGARKGEGIFIADTNNYFGKGPSANGGGGGNDHNSGGGGGSNFGAGGLGGDRINASTFSCPGGNPGIGGRALQYDNLNNKIYMGGGGGAGEGNNHLNTKGGNGGGILILIANEIEANNVNIFAKGDSVKGVAAGDAAGGGGGGGTVLLDANIFTTTNLNINVNGARGGNVNNGFDPSPTRCMGPGGGGGGGAVWFSSSSTPAGINITALGGPTGITSWAGADPSCALRSNGGRDGDVGGSLFDLQIAESNNLYIPHTFSVCCDTIICKGQTVYIQSSQQGSAPLTYSWNTAENTANIFNTPTSTVTFICVGVDGIGCPLIDSARVIVESLNLNIYAAPSDTILEGTTVTLNAILSTLDPIFWTPTTGLNNINTLQPTTIATNSITYCAYGETSSGCKDTDCVTLIVIPNPDTLVPEHIAFPNAFSPNGDGNNDLFTIIYSGNYDIQNFSIFNRWGEIVFTTSNINEAWNGKFKGKDQEIGTYIYYLTLKDSKAILPEKKYTGNIMLIR